MSLLRKQIKTKAAVCVVVKYMDSGMKLPKSEP